jgi:hypothetical protein
MQDHAASLLYGAEAAENVRDEQRERGLHVHRNLLSFSSSASLRDGWRADRARYRLDRCDICIGVIGALIGWLFPSGHPSRRGSLPPSFPPLSEPSCCWSFSALNPRGTMVANPIIGGPSRSRPLSAAARSRPVREAE